ncbi:MAG: ABC transporter permease [Oscillospiraceae bacterium]|jgi:simple sugar transport system permease protein|nr:ABC transporter permease [Oscillospiraceae bacterium]
MDKRGRLSKFGAGLTSAASSAIAILVGLAVGFIILLATNPGQAVRGLGVIVSGGFNGGMKGLGQVLYYATPLILTGLSVGFCFKTGLFNIGSSGQLIVGAFAGIWVGANAAPWIPAPLLWLAALLAATLAGAAWGAIPGLFKSLLNVHEVIACIMCNYIGMYGVNFLIKNSNVYDPLKNQTIDMTRAAIPKAGLDRIFFSLKGRFLDASSVNGGIFIALALAIATSVVLDRTVFGYELKACGLNRFASRYAGINEKRGIFLSLAIAGGLSGAAGGLMYLAPAGGLRINVIETLAAQGFNGIPVALLGLSNPIGIIFSALFVAYIEQGGYYLQRLEYMPEIINIIIAVIIYFSAFALLMRQAVGAARSRLARRSGKRARGREAGRA